MVTIIRTNLIPCKAVRDKEIMLGSTELWIILILFRGLVTFGPCIPMIYLIAILLKRGWMLQNLLILMELRSLFRIEVVLCRIRIILLI